MQHPNLLGVKTIEAAHGLDSLQQVVVCHWSLLLIYDF